MEGCPQKGIKEFLSWQPLAQEVWMAEMAEYFETRLGKRCRFWHQCPCLSANYREEGLAGGCRPHTGHREVLLVSSGLWGHLLLQGWVQFLVVKTSQEGLSWNSVFQHLSGHPEALSLALPSPLLRKEMKNPKTTTTPCKPNFPDEPCLSCCQNSWLSVMVYIKSTH